MIPLHGLHLRAVLIQALRTFFIDRGYLEVDTPIRIPAPAPEAYIEPITSEGWFLQTSPELCMKRLLAAGIPRIFQLCKCFRKGERGDRHLPEFTMLEWYAAGSNYRDQMTDCEALLRHLALAIGKGGVLEWQGCRIDLGPEWERLTVAEGFRRYAPCTVEEALRKDQFDELLVEYVEPHLGMTTPTFLYDYPAVLGALARLSPTDPSVAERFELYVAGLELANGFSELVDPVEQRARFLTEQETIRLLGRDPGPMPERFLDGLELMPPAAGIALGVERLVMLFAGAEQIDQVVSFTPEGL
ncbi:EF-P lysine aminoacylase EpmA [Thiovibrio frasassiensis]|uniref:EF-P lysine aminoacylase EpmA n=1 Tax=Thiovibrio frasassiensis TaxID=2984131 RepID=A0A9X4MDM0_9BACT|nr:EF-P lysine aminoacylase EpmA [Thiovibrio frasassiensis]MDG4474627.1 EF-P lysine aminoacylase EpmA [Thiovibrio frasassiensis]